MLIISFSHVPSEANCVLFGQQWKMIDIFGWLGGYGVRLPHHIVQPTIGLAQSITIKKSQLDRTLHLYVLHLNKRLAVVVDLTAACGVPSPESLRAKGGTAWCNVGEAPQSGKFDPRARLSSFAAW